MKKYYWLGMLFSAIVLFCSCTDKQDNPVNPKFAHVGHEYVDLGLPSGALWAVEELNVAGSTFFAWGETTPKSTYTSANYQFLAGKDSTLTKYCVDAFCGNRGMIDGMTELQSNNDPAHVNWGGKWCMPTWSEWEELYNGCTWETIQAADGTNRFVGTSKTNGNKITIPSTGAMQNDEVLYKGGGAFYWSSSVISDSCMYVAGMSFSETSINFKAGKRTIGHCVRPVIPGNRNALLYVDLGLPSGIKWATTNLGALKPEGKGLFYAWGEVLPKSYYEFTTYRYCSETNEDTTVKTLSKYVTDGMFGLVDNLTQLEPSDDVATQLLGSGWRIPTLDEIKELLNTCEYTVETVGEQQGTRFTGPNGNSIFIPWVGTKFKGELEYPERGYYWGSTLGSDNKFGEGLFLSQRMTILGNGFTRCSGRCIRAVHE